MKSATIPPIRVEPEFRREIESMLDEGESLSEFVEASLRSTVAWRRTQDAFLARSHAAIEHTVREGGGVSPEQLLAEMRKRLEAARRKVAARSRTR